MSHSGGGPCSLKLSYVRLKVFVAWHLGHGLADKKTAERAEETHNTERDKGRQPARRLGDDGQSHQTRTSHVGDEQSQTTPE